MAPYRSESKKYIPFAVSVIFAFMIFAVTGTGFFRTDAAFADVYAHDGNPNAGSFDFTYESGKYEYYKAVNVIDAGYVTGDIKDKDRITKDGEIYRCDVSQGDEHQIGPKETLEIKIDIPSDSLLAKAVADRLVTVKARVYFIWAKATYFGGAKDSARIDVEYWKREDGDDSEKLCKTAPEESVWFPLTETGTAPVVVGRPLSFPDASSAVSSSVRVRFSEFNTNDAFSMAFKEMGVRITFAPRNNGVVANERVRIIEGGDSVGYRSKIARPEYVKSGDKILLSNRIKFGNDGDASSGDAYRRIFMDDGSDETVLRYTNAAAQLERSYKIPAGILPRTPFPEGYYTRSGDGTDTSPYSYAPAAETLPDGKTEYYGAGGDFLGILPPCRFPGGADTPYAYYKRSGAGYAPAADEAIPDGEAEYFFEDKTGEIAFFEVKNSNDHEITFGAKLSCRSDAYGKDGFDFAATAEDYKFFADAKAPNAPTLRDNVFFEKYLSGTKERKYITRGKEEGGNTVRLDLGSSEYYSVTPEFSEESLFLSGGDDRVEGSPQSVYYKVGREKSGKIPTVPANAEEFSLEEASGTYCRVDRDENGEEFASYGSLNIDLQKSGGGYYKEGVYGIDFMSVDDVGNRTLAKRRYYIKVDVTEYVFSIERLRAGLQNSPFTPDEIAEMKVRCAVLGDDGRLSAFSQGSDSGKSPVLHRGDKVVVELVLNNKKTFGYFLSAFKSPSAEFSCEEFLYRGNTVTLIPALLSEYYKLDYKSVSSLNPAPSDWESGAYYVKNSAGKYVAVKTSLSPEPVPGTVYYKLDYEPKGRLDGPPSDWESGAYYFKNSAKKYTAADISQGPAPGTEYYRLDYEYKGQFDALPEDWASGAYYIKNSSGKYTAVEIKPYTFSVGSLYKKLLDAPTEYYSPKSDGTAYEKTSIFENDKEYFKFVPIGALLSASFPRVYCVKTSETVYTAANTSAEPASGADYYLAVSYGEYNAGSNPLSGAPSDYYTSDGENTVFSQATGEFRANTEYFKFVRVGELPSSFPSVYCTESGTGYAAADTSVAPASGADYYLAVSYGVYMRWFGLEFKKRVKLEVSGTKTVYDGDAKNISVRISDDEGIVIPNATWRIAYYRGSERLPGSPVDAGTYRYTCRLDEHAVYYGEAAGSFEIAKADPEITDLQIITDFSYGQSMSEADSGYDGNGGQAMTDKIVVRNTSGSGPAHVSDHSSDGVFGYYTIVSPSSGSEEYRKPDAGSHNVTIKFTPIRFTIDAYGKRIPERDENGKFIPDENYKPKILNNVLLRVNHSDTIKAELINVEPETEQGEDMQKIVLQYSGTTYIDYVLTTTDETPGVDITERGVLSYYSDASFAAEKKLGSAPTMPGKYYMRLETDKTACNYYKTFDYILEIVKKSLIVTCPGATFPFRGEELLSPKASETPDSAEISVEKYGFTYYRYIGGQNLSDSASDENLISDVEPENNSDIHPGMPVWAGQYVAKILIDDERYENDVAPGYALITIEKGTAAVGGRGQITYPSMKFRGATSDCHLFYLQPFSEIGFSANVDAVMKYRYGTGDELLPVPGKFRVVPYVDSGDALVPRVKEDEESYCDYSAFLSNYADEPVGKEIKVGICFIPDDERNFAIQYGPERKLSVGKAAYITEDMRLGGKDPETDEYYSVYDGRKFESDVNPDGTEIPINGKLKILLKVKAGETPAEYLEIEPDDENYGYTVKLNPKNEIYGAGRHIIPVTITPKNTNNFKALDTSFSLIVKKRPLTLSVVSEAIREFSYGADSGTIAPEIEKTQEGGGAFPDDLKGAYKFYRVIREASEEASEEISSDPSKGTLDVGRYKAVYELTDDNYSGRAEFYITVTKADLEMSAEPAPGSKISYGDGRAGVLLSGGKVVSAVTRAVVPGKFKFDTTDGSAFSVVGEISAGLIFTPDNTDCYNAFTASITVTVGKRDLSDEISVALPPDDVIYGDLEYRDNGYFLKGSPLSIVAETISFTETETVTPAVDLAALPKIAVVGAGSHTITAKIPESSEHFEGSRTFEWNIGKKTVFLRPKNIEKEFCNGNLTVDYDIYGAPDGAEPLNLSRQAAQVEQEYRDYAGAVLSSAPSAIGTYAVRLRLIGGNYAAADAETPFTVYPNRDYMTVINGEQVYGQPRDLEIIPGANGESEFDISFEAEGVGYPLLPVKAGLYDVVMTFAAELNNGYAGKIVMENGLKISKARALITVSDVRSVYTGEQNTRIAAGQIRTEPGYLRLNVDFYDDAGNPLLDDEGDPEEPISVGEYGVRYTVDEPNYEGEKEIRYIITPAAPIIRTPPTCGDFEYGRPASDLIFFDDGEIVFGTGGVSGVYSAKNSDVTPLNVGLHEITYTFRAGDYDGENFVPNRNYKPVAGKTKLNVVKRNVSAEYFVFGELSASYDERSHSVTCGIDEERFPIPDRTGANRDFFIRVYYNNSPSPPRECGEYSLTAVIEAVNYEGSAEETLTVGKGEPLIVEKPSCRNYDLMTDDATMRNEDLVGGKAVIEGTETEISGTFSLKDGPVSFTIPDYNEVEIIFTPSDANKFLTAETSLSVFVFGENPLPEFAYGGSWDGTAVFAPDGNGTSVKISVEGNLIYGVKLSDLNIKFVKPDGTELDSPKPGALKFVDGEVIPEPGELVEVCYIPEDARYHTARGKVDPGVGKAVFPADVALECKAYKGKTFADAAIVCSRADGGKTFFTPSGREFVGDVKYYSDAEYSTEITDLAVNDFENRTVYVRISHSCYENKDFAIENFAPRYEEFSPENILFERTSKPYDGKAITAEDLGVRAANCECAISQSDFTLRVYPEDGREAGDAFGIGKYVVDIILSTDRYYCVKNGVEFEITKKDISSELTITPSSGVFGGITELPKIMRGNRVLSDSNAAVTEFKAVNAAEYVSSVADLADCVAGVYLVRISYAGETEIAERVFEYTIEPRPLRAEINGCDNGKLYTDYGVPVIPQITFFEGVGSVPIVVERTVYFNSPNLSKTENLPVNAGSYTAEIVVPDGNYKLSDSKFVYVVRPLAVNPSTPVPKTLGGSGFHLRYGQPAGDIRFETPSATDSYGNSVPGEYVIENPNEILHAGSRGIVVAFIPRSKNYRAEPQSLTVKVGKAEARVTYTNLTSYFNASDKSGEVKYTVEPEISVGLTFSRMSGENVVSPSDAGIYLVKCGSLDDDYEATSSNNVVFRILRAEADADKIEPPSPAALPFGRSLSESSFEGGRIFYKGLDGPCPGTFSFVYGAFVPDKVAPVEAEYKFTPKDESNYMPYSGVLTVDVVRASASLSAASRNAITYGDEFIEPEFSTEPAGLRVLTEGLPDAENRVFLPVGIYEFTAWVDDENYCSARVKFSYVVEKRRLDMDFVGPDGDGGVQNVLQIIATYGKPAETNIRLYPDGTEGKRGYFEKDERSLPGYGRPDDAVSAYEFLFESMDKKNNPYNDNVAPSNVGVYKMKAVLRHNDYAAEAEIIYKIERGKIDSVTFDSETLEKQVYGAVSPPVITTTPAGVNYYIIYGGSDRVLPSGAGSYDITVYFDDENYEKKQVSAVFKINRKPLSVVGIEAEDKVYDGLNSIKIRGQLSGLLHGDEVLLNMTAETSDGGVDTGYHGVKILSCELSGLQARNYDAAPPEYRGEVFIGERKIVDKGSDSFITGSKGFASGTTVEFSRIDSKEERPTFFEKMTGRESVVIGYTVKENGLDTISREEFKVYVKIPEKFAGKDFSIKGVGALRDKNVIYTREGDYVSFYAASSGQIKFSLTKFRYEYIVVIIAAAAVLLGAVLFLVLNPLRRNKKVAPENTGEREAVERIRKKY